ncbi:hypothetical protein GBAR_LOCUS8093, partial [Geodia barretti]
HFYSLSDKDISVHLILLQLRTVQSCWRALGEAAGLERETMDMIDRELGDDSAKLAEVMFRWYERKECVRWSDVSSLCEQIGFNQLSEAISTAYITGEFYRSMVNGFSEMLRMIVFARKVVYPGVAL